MEQNRFKSKVLWLTVATLVVGLLMQIGVIGNEQNEQIMQIVGTVLEIFSIFGILNNPTDKEHF